MINRYGLLTRSEKSENQTTIRDPELSKVLNDLYITDNKDFWGELNGWCTTSSSNRCCFYMSLNYENKTYTKPNRKIPYVLPTYGVKGIEAISRDMKYVNQYLQKQEDMLSRNFIDYVFGTNYIEHEEPQTLISESMAVERMRRKITDVSYDIEDADLACRVLERIWAAREKDSKTRVILVLDKEDIERKSMNLLRQVYLLMPQRLRVQTGFATNINIGDLDMISKNSLPMYILTVDDVTVNNITKEYRNSLKFPVEFIDVNAIKMYPCKEDRVNLIRLHCDNLSGIMDICMAYAERKVMEKNKQGYSSFRIYYEILEKTYLSNLFWWSRNDLTSIEEICSAHMDQQEIMEVPQIKNEAVREFYMKHIPNGNYAEEILNIVCNPEYPNRESILSCLSEQFYYGKEIEAIAGYVQKRDEEQACLQNKLNTEAAEKLSAQEKQMREEKELLEKNLSNAHAAAMKAKEEEIQEILNSKKQMCDRLEHELEETKAEHAEVLRKKEQELAGLIADKDKFSKENKDLQIRLKRSKGYTGDVDIESLEKQIEDQEHKIEKLKLARSKAKTGRNVCLALAIVFAIAGAGVVGYGCLKAIPDMKVSLRESFESEMVSESASESEAKYIAESESESEVKRIAESESESEAQRIAESESESEAQRIAESESESESQAESESERIKEENAYKPLGILM